MFTDMVGYTALGQRNEALSLSLVEEQRKLIRPILSRHSGREIKTIGDAFLVEFPNALDAVRCAYDIQRATREFNVSLPTEKRIHLRIGLHLGDVVESQGDISGDAVNVASRIEPLAEEGGVCITRQVYDHVSNKFELSLASLGPKALKNVTEPMEVFKVVMPWDERQTAHSAKLDSKRIAILPFANMSPDPNDEYFADGITDEIITTVSGISGLKVISRTSVMGYKGTTKKLTEIGRELGVGSILEGSFKKAGSKIRVTTQLIDVAGDEHLWAQNYDRNLDDVFEVQSDVAKQVADALRIRVLSSERERIEKKPTESTSAYTLYLKGRHYWNTRFSATIGEGIQNLKNALKCLEQSVEEDPRFALGYTGQADCYLTLRTFGLEPEANLKKAKEMVGRALELDSELAEAHATKGIELISDYRFKDAESELRKAIELKPSHAVSHYWYYLLLSAEFRWEEALDQIEKALELDPLSPLFNFGLANFYFSRRDYGKALELYRRAIELGASIAHETVARIYGMMKMYDDMRREFAAYVEVQQGSSPWARANADFYAAYYENDRQRCRDLLPELEAHYGQERLTLGGGGMDALDVALAYFCLGENDKGFEWLEHLYSRREFLLASIKIWPELDGVRADPRYLDLVKRLGLD
jgi:TolB-like protein